MPTDIDVKLATDLADFRVDVERRFGAVEKELVAFRSAVETELSIIRKLGTWLLGGVFGAVGTMIIGSATIAWSASSVNSKVEQHGARLDQFEGRLDRVEKRLDGIDRKLDTLISRTASKAER